MKPAANSFYGISNRDLALLKDLGRMRYLRTTQIQALHFPSRRVANRRLGTLYHQGYTDRFRLPTLVGQGSSDYIYCLKEQGEEILFTLETYERQETQRPHRNGRPKNFFLMEHHLAINDFWIALEGACRSAGVNVMSFIPEYYGQKTEEGGLRRLITDSAPDLRNPNEKIWFTPDAMFTLERNGKHALFFLEIDRGTEKITSGKYAAFANKITAYQSYFQSRGFRRWGEQFTGFRVLVVTNSEERKQNLVLTSTRLGIQKMLWYTVDEAVQTIGVLNQIWQLPAIQGLLSLYSSRCADEYVQQQIPG